MTINVAIIGSGPSGFYTADSLLKSDRDVQIDIIERLPTPFGLIRGGVAPDHQTTKKVAKAYEKTALKDEVAYFGNVDVGTDVSMDELLQEVRGGETEAFDRAVDSHISNLRAKIEVDPRQPEFIKTVWGVGYRWGG